ncbi:MAG: hypothetical protein WDO56_04935 [Gammaproteobacteria bacterium]
MNTSASATDTRKDQRSALYRPGIVAFAAITLAYALFFARLTSFPYQDFPNHLTRAAILADLLFHHGATYGQMFDFRPMPVPYLLGDLLLAGIVELFGPTAGGALWAVVVLLSWPAALLFLAHVNRISRDGRLFLLFVSLYLATDWFFMLAFTQFRLGMALMVVALGVAHLLRLRWTAARFAMFCALVLAGYFTHLVFVIFLAPCLIVSAGIRLYFRRTTWRTELALIAPVLAVMVWHFGFADRVYRGADISPYTWLWGTPETKFLGLQLEFLRFGDPFAKSLMLLFALALGWGLWRDVRWNRLLKPEVLEPLALAVTFLGIYIVLPSRYSQAAYVDVRALALISLFVILARMHLAEASPTRPAYGGRWLIPIVALLSVLNLGYLWVRLTPNEAWGEGYREIVARIPRGATVLPIYTNGRQGTVAPRLHMSSFIVLDRVALMPYLFSGDGGHPMKYFRYRRKPYVPMERWYNAQIPVEVAWQPVSCSYDYLIVGKPFDEQRIKLRTSTVAENSSAALLAVDHSQFACPTPAPSAAQTSSDDAASANPRIAAVAPAVGKSFLRARK